MRLRIVLAKALIFGLLTLTGCSQQGDITSSAMERLSKGHVTISTPSDPSSFDPRIERMLDASTYLRMIYEGLTRADSDGIAKPAAAEKIDISDDLKTYIIYLRNSQWSNGEPVTAQDFVETWLSLLSPDFPAPNAYQFYVIAGAKDYKEGRVKSDGLGIKALNDKTIEIKLEQPTPYFLDLLSCHFFFPVHHSLREKNQKGSTAILANAIGNGPFTLTTFFPRSSFSFKKNPTYWDAPNVYLEQITFQVLEELIAYNLFEAGEVDWAGSPLSTLPRDTITPLKASGKLRVASGASTYWLRINTRDPFLSNPKIRKALAYSIDRKALVDYVTRGSQTPATAIVPPSFGLSPTSFFGDYDPNQAAELFEEGLHELSLSKEGLSPIKLSYVTRDLSHKIAQTIQQEWKKVLGIDVQLENSELQVLIDRLNSGTYQISLGNWFADFIDPINFLSIFGAKSNSSNQTGWENNHYTLLIDQSNQEGNRDKRFSLLSQAQKILMDEMPVVPLFYGAFNYVESPALEDVYFSPLGFLDFKTAKIK